MLRVKLLKQIHHFRYVSQIVLLLLSMPAAVEATVIAEVSVEDLSEMAENCGVFRVKEKRIIIEDGVQTNNVEYVLDVIEDMCSDDARSEIIINLNNSIIGIPDFDEGDRLFLFLRPSNSIETVLGLKFHSYRVGKKNEIRSYTGSAVKLIEAGDNRASSAEKNSHKLISINRRQIRDLTEASSLGRDATVENLRQIIKTTFATNK